MRRILIFPLVVVLFFAVGSLGKGVLASTIQCNTGDQGFNTSTGVIQYCVGGFSSAAELKSYSVDFKCVKEKGAALCGPTNYIQTYALSSVPDSAIQKDSNGYFTCFTMNINNQTETLEVRVKDPGGTIVCRSTTDTTTGNSNILCSNGNGIDTAIGCIPISDQNALIGFILKWAIGIGGGIAFLMILFAGFQIMTSRGDPKRLQAGQELMTSAIAGLLLLIFSVIILKIIGVDILQLQIGTLG